MKYPYTARSLQVFLAPPARVPSLPSSSTPLSLLPAPTNASRSQSSSSLSQRNFARCLHDFPVHLVYLSPGGRRRGASLSEEGQYVQQPYLPRHPETLY